jgi:hypothetical protein
MEFTLRQHPNARQADNPDPQGFVSTSQQYILEGRWLAVCVLAVEFEITKSSVK